MSKNGPGSRKEERRLSANKRMEAASKRTPEEQLARLDAANLVAKKERAKLAARIKAREQRNAVKALMQASPKEFGEAAVQGAKKSKNAMTGPG